MGLLDFKYQAALGEGQTKEQVAAKLTEFLQSGGCTVNNQGGDLVVSGMKNCFNAGSATIKINEKEVCVECKIMPSIPLFCGIGVSVLLDLIGLFKKIAAFEDLALAIIATAFGAAGTIGCVVAFFAGKELLRHELALIVGRATK